MQDEFENYMPNVINHIESSIKEANNDLLTYSLAILKHAFRNTDIGMNSMCAQ
jgi:hypothetical protein